MIKKYGPVQPISGIHPVLTWRCLCPPIADKSDSPGSLILCLFFGKVFPLLGFQIQISKAITLHTVDCVWILSPQIPFTKSARFSNAILSLVGVYMHQLSIVYLRVFLNFLPRGSLVRHTGVWCVTFPWHLVKTAKMIFFHQNSMKNV